MIKVLTPQQLKEHNKLLEQQLLLDKENEKEEDTEDYQERLVDGAERIASIGDTISTLQETIESVVRKDDINELKNTMQSISSGITKTKAEINKSIENKSNIKHTHTMASIEGLIDELDGLQSQLNNTTQIVNNELKMKLGNDYKPKVEDVIGLKEELNKLYEKIRSIKIPEVDLSDYYKKEEVYNKEETYDKETIDDKIRKHKTHGAGYNYINDSITDPYFTRSSEKIAGSIGYITIGVTGSGATYECDGTADEVQIQQAIDALGVLGGGTIRFLSGTYNIETVVMVNDISIVGDKTVTIKAKNALNSYMIDMFDVTENVSFDGIIFDGNSSNQTYGTSGDIIGRRAVSTPTKTGIKVLNCTFKNVVYEAINADNRKYNCVIANNDIQETMYAGIRSHSNEGMVIAGNTINCEGALFCGIFVDGRNNHITDNTITVDGTVVGIKFENDGGFAVSYNTVANNTVLGSDTRDGYGISLIGSNIKYNTFTGNTFKNLISGYHQLATLNTVNGGACYDCTYGVALASVDSACIISGYLMSGSANGVYNNSGTKCIINNCIFSTCGYGYREVNSADYNNLDGNIFDTITTTAITVVGAGTIQSNNLTV